jgi:hypothetical protein
LESTIKQYNESGEKWANVFYPKSRKTLGNKVVQARFSIIPICVHLKIFIHKSALGLCLELGEDHEKLFDNPPHHHQTSRSRLSTNLQSANAPWKDVSILITNPSIRLVHKINVSIKFWFSSDFSGWIAVHVGKAADQTVATLCPEPICVLEW